MQQLSESYYMTYILHDVNLNASFMPLFCTLNLAIGQKSSLKGIGYMDYITRMTRNIKRDFPEITDEELQVRLKLAQHLIALMHQEKDKHRLPAKPLC